MLPGRLRDRRQEHPLETYRALGEPIPDGEYCRRLMALADELDIILIAGMLEADGEARYNTAVLIGPDGTLLGKYHKQKLGHEQVRNTPGSESLVFPTPHGRAGLMICADRTERSIVEGYRIRGAEFLICPSGGMFGPATNDPIVQARSRENRMFIVFVHPAEFLVTAPDGSIAKRVLLGDRLLVKPDEVGTPVDLNAVIEFDLPVPTASSRDRRASLPYRVDPATINRMTRFDSTGIVPKRTDSILRRATTVEIAIVVLSVPTRVIRGSSDSVVPAREWVLSRPRSRGVL